MINYHKQAVIRMTVNCFYHRMTEYCSFGSLLLILTRVLNRNAIPNYPAYRNKKIMTVKEK